MNPPAVDPRKRKYMLSKIEWWWALNYDLLLARGYRLRDRYNETALRAFFAGDMTRKEAFARGILLFADDDSYHWAGMDAQRVADGSLVWIKPLLIRDVGSPEAAELRLNKLLAADHRTRDDPANHCLPMVDSFVAAACEYFRVNRVARLCAFMVFPWELCVERYPFRLAAEALDFVRQLLEGLAFLHGRRIAHRDIHAQNVLFTSARLWTKGIHPLCNVSLLVNTLDRGPALDRIEVPVRYHFIDLGNAVQLPVAVEGDDRRVVWTGGFHRPPEVFNGTTAQPLQCPLYDAFAADVWQLGTTLSGMFRKSIPSLTPLLLAMTADDPALRPTAEECIARFERVLTGGIPRWRLLMPVRDASPVAGCPLAVCKHYADWARLAMKALRRGLFKKPRP